MMMGRNTGHVTTAVLLVAFYACAGLNSVQAATDPNSCICPDIYKPVCGVDGVEYSNYCRAQCVGVAYTDGPCPCPLTDNPAGCVGAICPDIVAPVCGCNNKTYNNACLAECSGIKKYTEGACPVKNPSCCPGVLCVNTYAPVCGSDGKTYNNSCLAGCACVTYTKGACPYVCPKRDDPSGCLGAICPDLIAPVCGCNGKTYNNYCLAKCSGIKNYTEGKCPPLDNHLCCPGVLCINTNDPVCASNGQTYKNGCEAKCACVYSFTQGACTCDECTKVYAPVCSTTGKTFPNRCVAVCNGFTVASEGKCGTCTTKCNCASKGQLCQLGGGQCCKGFKCVKVATDPRGLYGTCQAS